MKERRAVKRWEINWQARLKLEGAVAFIDCIIGDLSFKGLKVALAPALPADTFLNLDLVLSEECALEDIAVWPAWHRKVEDINLYGLYFSRIRDADKEKIYRFIKGHFPKLLYSQWWDTGPREEDEEKDDRRVFERFRAELPLRFLNLSDARPGEAVTEDVSAKGVGFLAREKLSSGAPLEMWLEPPDKGGPLYLRGEVVWSIPKMMDYYRVGVKLEQVNFMELSRLLKKNA